MSVDELAYVYASLILHDDGIPITSRMLEKISTLVKAANLKIDSYWPPLFAKFLKKRSVEDLILSIGSDGGGAAVALSAAPVVDAATAVAPATEEKEEPKKESDDNMGFSLFD
ncbi:LOW QUALITY PROTEIN: large ribosomal subunit protein P1w-like [Typha angustifolia]|uniref:LOW QUALITY PROTEIN: large ribosomal subunit protein P1w-like n=1 Tax=Typha angustifolia TaxID=59011 RepID=UPI003C2EBC6B